MKNILKILAYFLGSIIVFVLLILVFHNYIISYTLTSVIKERSEGRAELRIDDFDIDLFTSSILIKNPQLILNEIYLDSSQNVEINRVAFNKIEIDHIGVLKLLKDRDIEALHILIDKPEFWITETGKQSKSSFHPEKLFEALDQRSGLFKSLQLKIEDIEIHYGSIRIYESQKLRKDPGTFDFTIILHRFNSRADASGEKQILFSEEVLFKIKDVNRELKSGYKLRIDSAIFSSAKNNLVIGGASLFPLDYTGNKIGLNIGQLTLNEIDLQEIRGQEDLSLRAIHLSDGYIDVYQNKEKSEEKGTSNTEAIEELKKIFAEFTLDSIAINRFGFRNIQKKKDTTIALDNINFLITGVMIDSGMFDDPFNEFLYDSIKLSTSKLQLDQLMPGMHMEYDALSYSNFNRNLKVSGISIIGNEDTAAGRKINLTLKELDIKGFSLKQFQKKIKQHLSINLIDPEINAVIDISESKQNKKHEFIFPKHLVLDQVNVLNGNIDLSFGNKAAIDVRGLNIEIDDFNFPDQQNNNFQYRNVSFNYNSLKGYLDNENCGFNTGTLTYNKQQLAILQIQGCLSLHADSKPVFLKSSSLVLNEFDLESLLFKKQLSVGLLQLNEPAVSGAIQTQQSKAGSEGNVNRQDRFLPITFNIGGIQIESGEFDASILLKDEQIDLLTDYDIKIGELKASKGDSLNTLLEQLVWDIRLSRSTATYRDHELKMKSFISDSYGSRFMVDSLSIQSNSNFVGQSEKLNIKDLELPLLELTGLDYSLFLLKDSIDFENLKVDGLKLDAILPETNQSEFIKSDPNEKIDPDKYLFFSYDTISLTETHLNIEKPGDSSHSIIQLKNFNLSHQRNELSNMNLFDDLGLELESFSFSDTVSNKYLSIKKSHVDNKNKSFIIEGVEGSNLAQKGSEKMDKLKSSLTFKSSNIRFENVFIQDKFPSKVEVGKLFIGDLDLDIQAGEKVESTSNEPASLKINLEILRRFTNIIKALAVDTTEVNDINLTYKSKGDSITKVFIADSIAFEVHNFDIDTAMIGQTDPQFIKRLSIDLRGRTHITPDSLYELKTGRLYYDFPNHQIFVDSFYVTPRYPDSIFFKKAVYQTDKLKLFGKRIEINDIDIDDLLKKKIIHCGSIDLMEFDVHMHRDKRYPRNPKSRPPLIRELLLNLNQKILIDSILVKDSKLVYKEIGLKSEKPGEILISDMNLHGYNLTNILKDNDNETVLNVNLNGKIMGKSDMNLSIYFPLYPDSTAFWLTGKTDVIEMVSLNSMTENLLGIGIKQGKGSIEIPLIIANDSIAKGTVLFRYKKLKLALYSRKKDRLNKGIFSPMVNFFINDLVVRSNNPRFARKPKQGMVYFQRDPQKGIVNYAWKGILSGLISTLGINNKDQRQERKSLKNTP